MSTVRHGASLLPVLLLGWGRLLLLAGCILLLRPGQVEHLALPRASGWLLGLLPVAAVLTVQALRARRAARS